MHTPSTYLMTTPEEIKNLAYKRQQAILWLGERWLLAIPARQLPLETRLQNRKESKR